jgi:hypothetical protein
MRIEIIRDELIPDSGLQLQMFTYAGKWHVRVVDMGTTLYCGTHTAEMDALAMYNDILDRRH